MWGVCGCTATNNYKIKVNGMTKNFYWLKEKKGRKYHAQNTNVEKMTRKKQY